MLLIVDFDRFLHVAKPASLGILVDVLQAEVRPRVGVGQVGLEHLEVDLDRFVVDVVNVLGDDGQLVLFPLLVGHVQLLLHALLERGERFVGHGPDEERNAEDAVDVFGEMQHRHDHLVFGQVQFVVGNLLDAVHLLVADGRPLHERVIRVVVQNLII